MVYVHRRSIRSSSPALSLLAVALVTLGGCSGGGGGGTSAAPSPGTLQFSAASYSVNEATGSVTVTVTRTGGSAGAVAVNYATANGGAQAPADYTTTSGTLNWTDGDSSNKTFTVTVANDASAEGPETVQLSLSNATGGAALGANANATLVIDDTPGTILFTQTDFTVLENAGVAKVTVSRVGGSNGSVSVTYRSADPPPNSGDNVASRRTATPGVDYTPVPANASLTFANGEPTKDIEIPILLDGGTASEPAETIDVALCDAIGTNVGREARAVLTIADFQATANPGIVLSPIANNRPGQIPVNIHPEITLSSLVDASSLTPTTAKIRCTDGSGTTDINSAQAIFDPDEMTVTVVPPPNTLPSGVGAACSVVLTNGVKDPLGQPITTSELVSDSFTIGSATDTAAPVASNLKPPNGSTGVNANTAVISATLSDYMLNTLSINPKNFQLSYSENGVERVVAGSVTFVQDKTTFPAANEVVDIPVTFQPACGLKPNTQYTARLKTAEPGVTKGIRDVTGRPLAADVVWSFATAP